MDDVIKLALKRYDLCVDADSEERNLAVEDLRFLNGEQWPEEVQREREDGRPCLVINRIPAFTRQVENDIRQVRPAVKVRGVDSQSDPKTAEVLNGMIRAIESTSNAEAAYDWAGKYAIDCGFGFWTVNTQYADGYTFDQEIVIKRVKNPFTVHLDPSRQESDGSDARFGFVEDNMPREEFEEKYPDKEGEWAGDGHDTNEWFSKDTVRIAAYWCITTKEETIYQTPLGLVKEIPEEFKDFDFPSRVVEIDTVKRYLMTANDILEETDWPGKFIPIVEVRGDELDIEGRTHTKGVVRDMMDSQRQYNYMRSAIVERIALAPKAPFIGAKGQFKNPKWNRANTKNYAYLEYDVVPGAQAPMRQAPPDISPGLTQELVTASEEFQAVSGMHRQRMGDGAVSSSGKAVNAWKVQSEVGTFHYVDNLARAMRYSGRILVDLIPKIYSGARIVNILEPDGKQGQVTVNQPGVSNGQEYNYDLNVGKYDAVVDIGPSYVTQRQEASETMMQMLQYFPQAGPIIGDLVAKNMDWPGADEIARRLESMLPQEVLQQKYPAIQQLLKKAEGEKQQMGQAIQMLQTQLQQAQILLTDKAAEIDLKAKETMIKEQEVRRKVAKDQLDVTTELTELELKYATDVPGAAV